MKKIGFLSLVFVVALSIMVTGSAFAEETINNKEKVKGLEVIQSSESIFHRNGVEVTVTRKELKGGKKELEKLIEEAKKEGQFIVSTDEIQNSSSITPMALGSSVKYGGNNCENNSFIGACAYGNATLSVNWAGFAGFQSSGTVIQQIVGKDGYNVTEAAGQPRVKAVAYGLVGGSSIVYNTYNYKATDWGSLTTFNFNESEPGVIVSVGISLGADFKYKLNGNWNNTTVWCNLTQQ
ncbi:hypothetical protein [Paenibacillus chitinolyticus]|uniref:hypothetical protein n=1 Tax=Paenibacillus chitinolyticus TaxID=79263 RepID=UPI0035E31996